jgi:FkbM family methyltransferase
MTYKNYSQNNEQELIIKYLLNKNMHSGKFLDIGAYDGETFSNVREIMLQFNDWSGVFVEPSSYCFYKLCDMYKMMPRRAELINLAVVLEEELTVNRLLEFYDSPMSAVSSTIQSWTQRGIENNKEFNEDGDPVNPRKVYVGQIGMKEILNKFGPTFDFINIDVEGYSAKLALQSWFDPNNYNCKIICVENDGMNQKLYNKFTNLGYNLIENRWENMIFVKG